MTLNRFFFQTGSCYELLTIRRLSWRCKLDVRSKKFDDSSGCSQLQNKLKAFSSSF